MRNYSQKIQIRVKSLIPVLPPQLSYGLKKFVNIVKTTLLVLIFSYVGGMFSAFPMYIYIKLAIIAFVVSVVFFFVNPLNAMMAFLFIRPVLDPYSGYKIAAGVPLTGFFAVLIIFFLVLHFFSDNKASLHIPNITPLIILMLVPFLSFFKSENYLTYTAFHLRMLSWFSIYIFIYNLVKTEKDTKNVLLSIIFSSYIPMGVGYYQFFSGQARVTSMLGQPNACAIYFCLVMFAAVVYLLQFKPTGKGKITIMATIASLLIMIILTFHRGSWIALAAGFLAIYVFYRKGLMWFLLFMILAAGLFYNEIYERIMDVFHPIHYQGISSWDTRMLLWHHGLNFIKKSPLLGSGLGSSEQLFKKVLGGAAVPHNDFLRLFIEMGLLGPILYLLFLLGEVKYYLSVINQRKELLLNIFVFGMLIYFIVLTVPQNNFYDVLNMGIFFSVLASSKKFNLINGFTCQTQSPHCQVADKLG